MDKRIAQSEYAQVCADLEETIIMLSDMTGLTPDQKIRQANIMANLNVSLARARTLLTKPDNE